MHEGYCLIKSAKMAPVGGSHLSSLIEKSISNRIGHPLYNKYANSSQKLSSSFMDFHQKLLLSDIKEALSVRRQEESGSDALVHSVEYELPDHKTITINRSDIRDKFITGDE